MADTVGVTYRGLSVGDELALSDMGPATGYLAVEQPMPVGTELHIAAGDLGFTARVVHVDERGEGVAQPGMRVALFEPDEAASTWWAERVTRDDPVPLAELEPHHAIAAPAGVDADSQQAAAPGEADAQRGGEPGGGEPDGEPPPDGETVVAADDAGHAHADAEADAVDAPAETPAAVHDEQASSGSRTQMMAAVDIDAIQKLGLDQSSEEFESRAREAAVAMAEGRRGGPEAADAPGEAAAADAAAADAVARAPDDADADDDADDDDLDDADDADDADLDAASAGGHDGEGGATAADRGPRPPTYPPDTEPRGKKKRRKRRRKR